MKSRITPYYIIDVIFILSYSVGYVSLLKYMTYAIFPIPESIQLLFFLSILYLFRFRRKTIKGSKINGMLVHFLFGLYLWEIFQGIIIGGDFNAVLVSVTNLLSTYIAYKYINNIINIEKNIYPVINAYSFYMYYTLFIVIVSSVLILGSVINPYSNPLGLNSLFMTNMEIDNTAYYFPGFLSVVYGTPSIFMSALNFPSLSGLSHESQAMFFTIYPALFLLYYKKSDMHTERKILLVFIITTIITTSLTAVICFLFTYFLHIFWKFKDKNQIKSALIIILLVFIVTLYVIKSQFNNIINAFILEKANFDTVGSSGSYSLGLLSYIISPSSLLGQGIYGSTAEQGMEYTQNCGYISSLLLISFYLFFLYSSLRNIYSDKLICHSVGLASFYFIAHSFKYGIQVFNNNYLFFMVFILAYAEKMRNHIKRHEPINFVEPIGNNEKSPFPIKKQFNYDKS